MTKDTSNNIHIVNNLIEDEDLRQDILLSILSCSNKPIELVIVEFIVQQAVENNKELLDSLINLSHPNQDKISLLSPLDKQIFIMYTSGVDIQLICEYNKVCVTHIRDLMEHIGIKNGTKETPLR